MSNSLHVRSTYRNIFQLALPVAIAILIPQLNILTNTLFLGSYVPSNNSLSTQDLLSATGIASIFYLTLAMIGYGLSSGVLMLMSRSAGNNNASELGKIFSNGVVLSLLVSAVLILMSWFVAPFIFEKTITDSTIKNAAIQFIQIRIWGLPFLMLCQLGNSFFLATSHSKKIIAGSAAQTVANILFDYLLIFGVWHFPEMGLNGTALASVIAEVVYMVVVFLILRAEANFISYSIKYFSNIDWKIIQETFLKSSPLIVQYFLSIGAWEVFFIFVEHLGKVESATSQILRTVFGVVGIAAWALGSTTNSMVSNLIGQNKLDEVIPLIKKVLRISFLLAFAFGFFIFIFPTEFLQLLSSDPQIISTGVVSLRIVVAATWMLSISTVYFNAVLGTGNTRVNMFIEILAILLYLSYCFIVVELWHKPLPYAWASEFVYWFSLFAMSAYYIYSGKWKRRIQFSSEGKIS